MAYPSAPVTLIRATAPTGTFKQYPYSTNMRPYLLDPLLDRSVTGFAGDHWLPTTGDSAGLVGLSADKHTLVPRTDAGGVAAVTVVGGTGYTSAPTVSIAAPSSGVTATAVAVITGDAVTSIFITNPGSGYTVAPTVTITGGGGTGATGTAVLDGRPTYSATSLTLKSGGINGLLTDFNDQTPFSAFMVLKHVKAGAIYMGAATDQTGDGGDFTYCSVSGLIQNNMRGSAGTTGNVSVAGTSVIADASLIFVGFSYDGTTRRLYTPGYALSTAATTKTLAARAFGYGNTAYKVSSFDRPVEIMEMGFTATAFGQTDFEALYARAKLRQNLFGRTLA